MSSGIFTRKAGKLIFHNKIQQSGIDITRFNIDSRSNRSANKIIIVGIGKVTQFSIVLRHRDKQSIQHTSKTRSKQKEANGKGRIKQQGWSGGEENERQMANNVNARQISLWWVLGMSWLEHRSPRQRRQKSFLLPLKHALVFPWRGKGDAAQ